MYLKRIIYFSSFQSSYITSALYINFRQYRSCGTSLVYLTTSVASLYSVDWMVRGEIAIGKDVKVSARDVFERVSHHLPARTEGNREKSL